MTWKARPTVYKGILMRSRLEAHFAAHLDASDDITWTYEPCAYANETGQYLPDFEVRAKGHDDWASVFIEVKPTLEAGEAVRARMAIIWDSDPRAGLEVICADGWELVAFGFDHEWRRRAVDPAEWGL